MGSSDWPLTCGGIALGALTVGRCDRIIQGILVDKSLSTARRVRSVLGLVCGYAVRDDAIPFNPVRDVQRLPMPEKKTAVLTSAQITGIRELMEAWRRPLDAENCARYIRLYNAPRRR